MKNKVYKALGMALLSLPTTQNNRANNKKKDIRDIESTSAAHMISVTQIRPGYVLIYFRD